jgi:hypothetical protein
MIDINKEAQELADEATFKDSTHLYASYFQGVIAGHNSKSTQAKVLQGQIIIIDFVNRLKYVYGYDLHTQQEKIDERFAYLQQQLKELENA